MKTFAFVSTTLILAVVALGAVAAVAPTAAATSCTPDLPCPPPTFDPVGTIKREVNDTVWCIKHPGWCR